jgi:rare lipoprotein A
MGFQHICMFMRDMFCSPKCTLLLSLVVLGACSFGGGGGGGQFLPGDGLPKRGNVDIAAVPNAAPKNEPLSATGNKPYSVFGKDYLPLQSAAAYRAEGIASWYGTKFHGRRTSSGEPYNMYAMSAAHRTLPLPSYVRVTNLANGRAVVVKVNDRGPFVNPERRIIDLSYVAAAKLGVVATGTARVRLEAVKAAGKSAAPIKVKTTPLPKSAGISAQPVNAPTQAVDISKTDEATSYLQMGAFSVRQNADQLLGRLRQAGVEAYLQQSEQLYKVKSGPYADADQALQKKLQIDRLLNIEARVVFE